MDIEGRLNKSLLFVKTPYSAMFLKDSSLKMTIFTIYSFIVIPNVYD